MTPPSSRNAMAFSLLPHTLSVRCPHTCRHPPSSGLLCWFVFLPAFSCPVVLEDGNTGPFHSDPQQFCCLSRHRDKTNAELSVTLPDLTPPSSASSSPGPSNAAVEAPRHDGAETHHTFLEASPRFYTTVIPLFYSAV